MAKGDGVSVPQKFFNAFCEYSMAVIGKITENRQDRS